MAPNLPEPNRSGPGTDLQLTAALSQRVAAAHAHAEKLSARDDDLDTADMSPEERRGVLNERRSELDSAREELRAATEALQAAFEQQLEATRAALAPLQKRADQMMSAVEAISLYLGSDEQVVMLREGEPADADTPITVYQDVLFMDEEMALAAEAAGISDATIDPGEHGWASFDQWLLESDAHVAQVCPTQRGVVALRSAREARRVSGPFDTDGSEVTHFLVVNGQQLAWVVASVDFQVGDRLVPLRDEFDRYFRDRYRTDADGRHERLRPGTPEWDRANDQAGAAQRHYLKVALILQGIVDRSTLLSPLPSDEVRFTSLDSYDAGHIEVVASDDGTQLPSGVMPYRKWHAQLVSELERGQRVVFGHIGFRDLRGDQDGPGVVHPSTASGPPKGVPLAVKRREGARFVVSYPRSDEVWREVPVPGRPGYVRNALVPSKGFASVTFYGDEDWVLPIDHPLVTIETLEWYLLSRENRRHFQHMVPLLRSALRVLREEASQEEPFRELAEKSVIEQHHVSTDQARELVASAISWFKTKNRQHRALLSGDSRDDDAFREVLSAVARSVAVNELVDDPGVVARIEESCPEAMFVGRRPDGTYVAITPADARDVYVHTQTFSAKRGAPGRIAEWVVCGDVRDHKTIRSTSRFDRWPRFVDVSEEATGPELEQLVALVRAECPDAVAVSEYSYWSSDGGSRTALRAWSPGDRPRVDEQRPLTGANTHGKVAHRTFRWKRTPDGVQLEESRWDSDSTAVQSSTVPELAEMLWVDRVAFEQMWRELGEPWQTHLERCEPLAEASRAAVDRLVDAWEQRAVEAEYAQFVAKYGAEAAGRWDVHRKAVARRLTFSHDRSAIGHVFDAAAERGLLSGEQDSPATFGELLEALTGDGYEAALDDSAVDDLGELTY